MALLSSKVRARERFPKTGGPILGSFIGVAVVLGPYQVPLDFWKLSWIVPSDAGSLHFLCSWKTFPRLFLYEGLLTTPPLRFPLPLPYN